jgi:hypothetical protein
MATVFALLLARWRRLRAFAAESAVPRVQGSFALFTLPTVFVPHPPNRCKFITFAMLSPP